MHCGKCGNPLPSGLAHAHSVVGVGAGLRRVMLPRGSGALVRVSAGSTAVGENTPVSCPSGVLMPPQL